MKRFRCAVIIIFAFCICSAGFSQEQESPSVVTIEKALKTSYIKDKENDTEIIKFSGDVIISVEKDGKKVVIRAETVNVDRKRNVLYASGNVRMEKISGGKISESVSSESVLLNTDSLEGIFTEGRVAHKEQKSVKLPDGASLIVSSELFSRDESETVTFKNGELTFCDDEDPHWKIKASRIWLLPGNEFAFTNALLYVGVVPLMYFPFFYYPKDELFFNPVFGYRPREGYFVQTTTYFIGQRALQSDDKGAKGFNFMKPTSLYEQELDGLVLHNLTKEVSAPPYFLKFIGDYYSTLGGMFGLAGDFKPSESAIKSFAFDVRLGFSKTVYPIEGYTQYISYSKDKKQHSDYGWFFGIKLPFRYAASFKTTMQAKGFSLNLAMPLYSDPYFDKDFADRKESMDWIDFFLKGAFSGAGKTGEVALPLSSSTNSSSISSYTWNMSGSYMPTISILNPWIESASLSSFSSSVIFSQQKTPKKEFEDNINTDWYKNSPNKEFFYPVQIKPLAFSLSVSGTPIKWPVQKKASDTKKEKERQEKMNTLFGEKNALPELLQSDVSPAENEQKSEDDELFKILSIPDISIPSPKGEMQDIFSYSLGYSIKPSFSSLLTYAAIQPGTGNEASFDFKPKDPKLSELSVKIPLDINSKLSWYSDLLSLSNGISVASQYQSHPVIASSYSKAERNRIVLNDYTFRKLGITNTNSFSIKPFMPFPVFKDSSISWNTGVKLLESVFIGTLEKTEWKYPKPEWDKKTITSHNLNFTFSAQERAFAQKISLQANLPPLTDSYKGRVELTFPFVSTSVETGYAKRENKLKEDWYFLPLVQTLSLTFFNTAKDGKTDKNKLTFAQRFEYNIKDKHAERLTAGIDWRNMRLAYEMLYGYTYVLDVNRGWVTSPEKKFIPYSLNFNANISNVEFKNKSGKVDFKPALATVLSWNIVKPTDSYFSFSPSFTFKINNFLNLSFSAESRNKELLRYMQSAIGFKPEIPGERNIFIDLFNSFAFWDEKKRNSSGFKIKRFAVKLEHDLHDWILNSEFKVEPRILGSGTKRRYDYKPYFTLSVQWKPLQGIKTVIRDEYGDFVLNPAK